MSLPDIMLELFGPDASAADLTWYQMTLRALLIYIAGVALVRIGKERFIGKSAVFDALLGFILGSVLSRAINGSAPLVETLAGSVGLVLIHSLFAAAAYRSHSFGTMVKGKWKPLVENGHVDDMALESRALSRHDLEQAMRLKGIRRIEDVALATFERNGEISFIERHDQPRVIEVDLQDGVQRVRIEIGSR